MEYDNKEYTNITEDGFTQWLKEQPLNTKIKLLTPLLVDENTSYRDLQTVTTRLNDSLRKQVHSFQSDTLKPRFDNAMMFDAISFQLENKAIPVEVFQYVQDLHQKDDDWMRVAKHTKLKDSDRSDLAREVVKCNFKVIDSVKEKGISIKDAINNGKTPTQQIRTISKYISLSDRVDMLEKQVSQINLRQTLTECRLERIEGEILNPNKVVALKLKAEGKTNKEIAKLLGISTKTVGRWFKKETE